MIFSWMKYPKIPLIASLTKGLYGWLAFITDQKFRSLNVQSSLLSSEMGICQLFLEGSQKSDLSLLTFHPTPGFEWTKVKTHRDENYDLI